MADDLRSRIERALADTHDLERELGGGGMSRTYVALERALGRRVVIKVLAPELLAGISVERFRREVLLAAKLQHNVSFLADVWAVPFAFSAGLLGALLALGLWRAHSSSV